jgi:hypothetical protein
MLALVNCGYQASRLVFCSDRGRDFARYLRHNSEIMLDLIPKDVGKRTHECALKFNIKAPDIRKKINGLI